MHPRNLTWPRLEEYSKRGNPLLLPIGSVEGHGAHLPISTDSLIASYVSDKLARGNGWISLPPVTYTIAVPSRVGNVGISQETLGRYLREIFQHFIDFGQKEFILILGHGGPEMKGTIKTECENLSRNEEVSILAFHVLKVLEDLALVDQAKDRHAGEWETSLMLSMYTELVGDTDVYGSAEDIQRYGVFGDPTEASKARGKRYLKRLLKGVEDEIRKSELSGFHCNWQANSEGLSLIKT